MAPSQIVDKAVMINTKENSELCLYQRLIAAVRCCVSDVKRGGKKLTPFGGIIDIAAKSQSIRNKCSIKDVEHITSKQLIIFKIP
jgi:hypothetical protein